MAVRPKNHDKWTDINAKIGDYFRERGYEPDRVDLESNWLANINLEFGLGRDSAEKWGFTPDELDRIDEMRFKAQADLNSRIRFYPGGTLSVPNPYAIPDATIRRSCQERLENLDNIIHMWDILAIIGVAHGPGGRPSYEREREEKPRFDLFHSIRDTGSSAIISSLKAKRGRLRYEAFADTAIQDKSPENKPEPALSDAKTGDFVKPQSKSPNEPSGPIVGKGQITEPPLSNIFSKKFLGEFGRPWADKAARIGMGEKDLKLLMDLGIKDRALMERIDGALREGGDIRRAQTEMKMLHYLKDQLCGGSVERTRIEWMAGGDARRAVFNKILSNMDKEWEAQQTDKFALYNMSQQERAQHLKSIFEKTIEKMNQIEADFSGSKIPEAQRSSAGDNLPPKIAETPSSSPEKNQPGEANVPGTEGQEVQTPPGGDNLPPELKNAPQRSAEKPPPKEMSKPPNVEMDMERPPTFPVTFPPREPGSETFPTKEPQSPLLNEAPRASDSNNPSQSITPIGETYPMNEPQSIPPPSETPPFTLPPLPSESKSWSLPSENLPSPTESVRSNFVEYPSPRVEGYSSTDDRGQNGGEAGNKPPAGTDENKELPKSRGGTTGGEAEYDGYSEGGSGVRAGYRPPEGRDPSGGLPPGENREAEARKRAGKG